MLSKLIVNSQDDLHRVYREMRALKKLHHQHVCQLFQIIETDKMIYLILEVHNIIIIIFHFSQPLNALFEIHLCRLTCTV